MQGVPFDRIDLDRLSTTLARFLPYTNRSAIALTGGVAIEIHCSDAGVSSGRTRVADLDFVAVSVKTIAPSVAGSLLVAHFFHLPQPGYPKFLVQVVDPETRLRIDVFPDLAGAIARAAERTVAGHPVRVLDPHSMLDHKVRALSRASAAPNRRDAVRNLHHPSGPSGTPRRLVHSSDLRLVSCSRAGGRADPARDGRLGSRRSRGSDGTLTCEPCIGYHSHLVSPSTVAGRDG